MSKKNIKILESEEAKFKRDMEVLYEKIAGKNNQHLESTMPVLKNLMKKCLC